MEISNKEVLVIRQIAQKILNEAKPIKNTWNELYYVRIGDDEMYLNEDDLDIIHELSELLYH